MTIDHNFIYGWFVGALQGAGAAFAIVSAACVVALRFMSKEKP